VANSDEMNRSGTDAAEDRDLRALDRLVGVWRVAGDAEGEVGWEWAPGGYFLLQHIDMVHDRRPIKAMEVIGRLHPLDGGPSADIRSRVYSYNDGYTIDYVYELEGDTLTIWGGEKGSPAFYRAVFSPDGNMLTGSWQWSGGGYSTVAIRVR